MLQPSVFPVLNYNIHFTLKIYECYHDLPDIQDKTINQTDSVPPETNQTTKPGPSKDSTDDPITDYIAKEMQASISSNTSNTFDHSRAKFDKSLNKFSLNLDGIVSELSEIGRRFDSVSETLNRLLTPDIPKSLDIHDTSDEEGTEVDFISEIPLEDALSDPNSCSITTSNISDILSCVAPLPKSDRFLRFSLTMSTHEELGTFSAFNVFKSDILNKYDRPEIEGPEFHRSDTINSCISELNSFVAVSYSLDFNYTIFCGVFNVLY